MKTLYTVARLTQRWNPDHAATIKAYADHCRDVREGREDRDLCLWFKVQIIIWGFLVYRIPAHKLDEALRHTERGTSEIAEAA